MGLRHLTGTPWHVERFTRKEGDKKRHRSRCVYYRGNGYCAWHFEKCWGSARCRHYAEGDPNEKKNYVLKVSKEKEKERKIALELDAYHKAKEKSNEEKAYLQRIHTKEYPLGSRIRHKTYGNGTIKEIRNGNAKVLLDSGKEIKISIEVCVKNHIISKIR